MLTMRRVVRMAAVACGLAGAASGLGFGCAKGEVEFTDDDASGGAATNSTTTTGGQGGSTSLCAQDCSGISTPPCLRSVCNEGAYQGQVGECVIVPDEGASCDDGQFCTTADTCNATGQCVGGPPNDCGMTAPPCTEITCNEDSDSCGTAAAMNGAPCQNPNDLCIKGSMCSNGVCSGGTPDDCFFFPVSDDCHVAECDPTDGMCKEEVGNEGGPCVDAGDLCTVNKTCTAGVCLGGVPKNCSQLTSGCVLGVCNTVNGQCTTQNLMNGDPCDDLNYCTSGELCNNGSCTGGTPVTQCVDGDNCCPSNCTAQNDLECNYPFGTARMTNGSLINVQYHPCNGTGTPGQCTAANAQTTCTGLGLKLVSHASNGSSSVFSLGATSSCYFSISYYTVNKQMPTNACLVGVSNLQWTSCCNTTMWHGNTVSFGAPNATFGYVYTNDSGYVSTNPNVTGQTWGCTNLTTAASNKTGCTTQYVACTP